MSEDTTGGRNEETNRDLVEANNKRNGEVLQEFNKYVQVWQHLQLFCTFVYMIITMCIAAIRASR